MDITTTPAWSAALESAATISQTTLKDLFARDSTRAETLSIEVGRAMIKIKDLMRLTQGSVVELDRIAGEPLDLLVNNTVVAQGEVVLVNERYGIRLTRVVPASERLKNL